MEDLEYGTIKIHLDELMKERNISLNKLSFRAEMQRTQLRKYRDNTVQRLDVAVNDLIEYVPPQK